MIMGSWLIAGLGPLLTALGGEVQPQESPPQDSVRAQVQLTAPSAPGGDPAPEGHFLVSWDLTDSIPGDTLQFEVHFATDPDFTVFERRDVGRDRATFLSGLPEGTTYVRVRAMDGDGTGAVVWSDTGEIVVTYPGMGLVQGLMILGTVMLVFLVAMIWRGHRTTETMKPDAGVPT